MNRQTRTKINALIKKIEELENNVKRINFRGSNGFVLEQLYKLTPTFDKLQLENDNIGALEIHKADKLEERFSYSPLTKGLLSSADSIQNAVSIFADANDAVNNSIEKLEDGFDVDLSDFSLIEVAKILKEV